MSGTLALLDRLAGKREVFPGALLLTGPSRARLEIEARRLAAKLLCPGEDAEGKCDSCRRTAAGAHPDLFVVRPEGVQIKVDRVRQALAFAAGRPYESSRRVALVLEAEQLGVEAANALLKSLEEPGGHLHWILTSRRPEALLPTILSRCTAAVVPAPSRDDRVSVWKERGFSADEADDLSLFADENADAASELLAAYRDLRERILFALERGLADGSPTPLLMLADDISRVEPPAAGLLAELLADAAVAAAASPDRIRHRAVAGPVGDLSRRRSVEALQRAAIAAADAPPDTRRGNRRLHFEALLLELLQAR
jgi:DNA polymerase-3 subunit delta'